MSGHTSPTGMMAKLGRTIALIIIVICSPHSRATNGDSAIFTLTDNNGGNVTAEFEYYKDTSANLSFEQVLALPDYVWQANDEDALRFGFTSDAYWLRLQVRNTTNEEALLIANQPLFDTINGYLVNSAQIATIDKSMKPLRVGLDTPPQLRSSIDRQPLFRLDANSSTSIWLKTQTSAAYVLSFSVWNKTNYLKDEATDMLFYGAYFGALVFASILFLVVSIALKQPAVFALSLLTIFTGVSQATILGLYADELWDPNFFYRNSLGFSVGGAIIAVYFFFSHSLKLKVESPLAEWTLKIIALLTLAALLATSFVGYQTTILITTSLSVFATVTTLAVSLQLALRGNQFAMFTTVAASAILLSNMQHALVELELVPVHFAFDSASYFGFVFMIFCLTLGLGYEVRHRQTKLDQQAEIRALELEKHQEETKAALEFEVQNRTIDLERALTDLASANESLKLLNTVDQVTGINNRYYFDTSFEQEWKRATREKYPLSLLMVDVDHFKEVNDTYGHVVGDECLRQIACAISNNIKRASDTVARFGGEEFVVLLPYSDNEHALMLAQKIRRNTADDKFEIEDHILSIRLSVGVATVIPNEHFTPKELITSADLALYKAKSSGRNKVCNAGNLHLQKDISA